jgi:MinD-like ATPase involved in chromosome partitioning or flagellar assembly
VGWEVHMGKILAICSDDKKTGKSIVSYLIANKLKKIAQNNLKILVCCLNLNYSALYGLFGMEFSAVGLEELVNHKVFEDDKSEIIFSIVPQSNGIYFLGSYRTTNSYIQKNTEEYKKLFEKLQNSFDIIIFDTVSGRGSTLTDLVMQRANIIVRLFEQDNESMKKLYHIENKELPYDKKTLYIVSKYRKIYPRVSDIKRRYSLKNIFTLEYCEKLQEMKNRDSLHLYPQHETSYNDSINCISKYILEQLNLLTEDEIVKDSSVRYICNLKHTFRKLKLIHYGGKEHEDTREFVPKRADGLY